MQRAPHASQLPAGVAPGCWDYAEAPFIARGYDDYIADHRLVRLDQELIDERFHGTGTVVDLGCGTGRSLLPLMQRGYQGVGIDLSQAMLETFQQKAAARNLSATCLRGNMVELDFMPDRVADIVLCLFSTLGMIRGHAHRQAATRHIHRILKPGGVFMLHVHNLWHNLWIPQGNRWLFGNLAKSCCGLATRGDKTYDYRGVSNFYLHMFTYGELRSLLLDAQLLVDDVVWFESAHRGDSAHANLALGRLETRLPSSGVDRDRPPRTRRLASERPSACVGRPSADAR